MARHYEKGIEEARLTVAQVGAPPARTEPRTRDEIESFVKGFGVSAASVKRIADEWCEDSQRSRDAGWESHADSVWYDS